MEVKGGVSVHFKIDNELHKTLKVLSISLEKSMRGLFVETPAKMDAKTTAIKVTH
jgi:hypothetical protein